jgi:hypothetical protein
MEPIGSTGGDEFRCPPPEDIFEISCIMMDNRDKTEAIN